MFCCSSIFLSPPTKPSSVLDDKIKGKALVSEPYKHKQTNTKGFQVAKTWTYSEGYRLAVMIIYELLFLKLQLLQ